MNESELVKKIKKKKELSGLSDSVVLQSLENYLIKYKLNSEKLKKSELKIVIKDIRAELRNLTGRFQKNLRKRKTSEDEDFRKILETHTSTSERLAFYPELKNIINGLKVNSILDLGCGLNPIALATNKVKYYASDIKEDELNIISQYFKKNKIKGKVFVYDLRNVSDDLPKADLCLIFKVLDIVDKKNHSLAAKIISLVKCKKILVSFSTKKLSGRAMNHPQRIWFEAILRKLNFPFKKINSPNEIFYLIDKEPSSAGNQEGRNH